MKICSKHKSVKNMMESEVNRTLKKFEVNINLRKSDDIWSEYKSLEDLMNFEMNIHIKIMWGDLKKILWKFVVNINL